MYTSGKLQVVHWALVKSKFKAAMAEARSQQAASITKFHWLCHTFSISKAQTRASILKETCVMVKELHDQMGGALLLSKALLFMTILVAYHEARGSIRNDLMEWT